MFNTALNRIHRSGLDGPREPFTFNRAGPLAQGIDCFIPVLNAELNDSSFSAVRDISGFERNLDLSSSPGTPSIDVSLVGKTGVHFTHFSHYVGWSGGAASAFQRVQKFTRVVRFYFTADASGETTRSIWNVNSRADIHLGDTNVSMVAGELGAVWYTGSIFPTLSAGVVAATDINILHEVAFSFESGDQRLYLDGVLMDSKTRADTIVYSSGRSASHGGGAGITGSPPMVIVQTFQKDYAWKDAEAAYSWNPATRWDLYYELGRRSPFFPVAAAGGRIMGSIAGQGGLAGPGGIAGPGGGLAA